VRELTWAKIAPSSTFNISTCHEHVEHHASLRALLTTTNLSVSTVISILVFISFGLALDMVSTHLRGQMPLLT
jgi:hypothetical protein